MKRLRLLPLLATAITLVTVTMTVGQASATLPTSYFPTSASWSKTLAQAYPAGITLDPGNSQMKSNWAWQNHDGSFWQAYGPNIYEVSEASQSVPVTCVQYCTNVPSTFRIPAGWTPNQVIGGGGSDGWAAIVNTQTRVELDLWQATWDGTTLKGNGGSQFNVDTGSGWACNNTPASHSVCFSATASGSALTAGTILPSDVASVTDDYSIHHALAFVPRFVRSGFTACPATHNDGAGFTTDPPEGAKFYLDSTFVPPANWPPIARKVARALQVYGGIVMDQGSWTFRFQANGVYTGGWNGAASHYPTWNIFGPTAFPWDKLNFPTITQC